MKIKVQPTVYIVALLAAVPAYPSTSPPLEDVNWALEHVDQCRRMLFGDVKEFQPSANGSVVVVLRYTGAGGLEQQVVLNETSPGEVSMHATSITGDPLVDQMARQHRLNPERSPEATCNQIEPKCITLQETDTGAALLTELRQISVSPILTSPIPFHGDKYELWIFSPAAQSHFEFLGLPCSEHSVPPLQHWSDKVLAFARQ